MLCFFESDTPTWRDEGHLTEEGISGFRARASLQSRRSASNARQNRFPPIEKPRRMRQPSSRMKCLWLFHRPHVIRKDEVESAISRDKGRTIDCAAAEDFDRRIVGEVQVVIGGAESA